MRQNQKYPTFTVILHRSFSFIGLAVLLASVGTGCTSCKTNTTVKIPKAILEAQDATDGELLDIVNRFDEIETLKATDLDVEYTSEKIGDDWIELQKEPRTAGLMLLRRPESIRFHIKAPVFGSRILDLVSTGDEFRVLNYQKKEVYIGLNSAQEFVSDELEEIPEIPIRAGHILEAVFPETVPLQKPGIRLNVKKETGEKALYYVLEVFKDNSSPRLQLLREFWIERAGLTLARQRIYKEDGEIASDISYSDYKQYEEYSMPRKISIAHPLDGYTLELDIKDWDINSELKNSVFELTPEEDVRVIRLKNK